MGAHVNRVACGACERSAMSTDAKPSSSNRIVRRRSIDAALLVFAVCTAVPAFAQSHSERRWDISPALAHDADRTSVGVVRVYRANLFADERDAALPPNLDVPAMYQELVRAMLTRSAVFRRQCARLLYARDLDVVLRIYPVSRTTTQRVRARTQLVPTPDRRLRADIEIRSLEDPVELIAHEIEHVIEQLDGIDLRRRATLPRTGVRLCEDGAYETTRAVRVGQAVAQEVRASRN
jgi:hypothetical protein